MVGAIQRGKNTGHTQIAVHGEKLLAEILRRLHVLQDPGEKSVWIEAIFTTLSTLCSVLLRPGVFALSLLTLVEDDNLIYVEDCAASSQLSCQSTLQFGALCVQDDTAG